MMTCTQRGWWQTMGRASAQHWGAVGRMVRAMAKGVFIALVAVAPVCAQANAASAAQASTSPTASKKSSYKPDGLTQSARSYYSMTLGVADLRVRRTNAGNLIRFTYRVTDPEKAKAINDRQATPYLIGHTSHVVLQVPVMEKVGPLRQATRPEANREYWMVFSNKGDVVKAGERVSVVVGNFRVDGLRVE